MTRDEKVLHSAHRYGAELDSPRIVSGFAARALPLGSVLVRAENGRPAPDVHAVVKVLGGWWSVDAPTPEPLAGDLWFLVLLVPVGDDLCVCGHDEERHETSVPGCIECRCRQFQPSSAGPGACCWLKVGTFTDERYCGMHGRGAGWPCAAAPAPSRPSWRPHRFTTGGARLRSFTDSDS